MKDTTKSSFRKKRQGSVLVAVLAVILLLSFMVTRFMNEAIEDIEYQAIFNEPNDVRSFAYSMLEVSLATLQEVALIDDGKLYAPEQGWGNPIKYAEISIPNNWQLDVRIDDESGKLPINTMDEALLNELLEETLDFDFSTARELSSSLLDWVDANDNARLNGAESDEYLSRNPPYKAANQALQSLEELRLLKYWDEAFFEDGVPNELFAQLSSLVSVTNSGPINLNAAPQAVIDILAKNDGWQQEYLFDGIEEDYLKQLPETVNQESGTVETKLLRITIQLRRGDVPFVISALVETAISSEPSTSSSSRPGSSAEKKPKTGSVEEQKALNLPFKILQISEYETRSPPPHSARHLALDIDS